MTDLRYRRDGARGHLRRARAHLCIVCPARPRACRGGIRAVGRGGAELAVTPALRAFGTPFWARCSSHSTFGAAPLSLPPLFVAYYGTVCLLGLPAEPRDVVSSPRTRTHSLSPSLRTLWCCARVHPRRTTHGVCRWLPPASSAPPWRARVHDSRCCARARGRLPPPHCARPPAPAGPLPSPRGPCLHVIA